MRFGHHHAPDDDAAQLDAHSAQPQPGSDPWSPGWPELFVRHARKDGRLVAILRGIDRGETCVVEAEVYPSGSTQLVRPGPYTFRNSDEAGAFVTEAVAALTYLGCEIQAT
jgi:hypothetical protein